MSSMMVVAWVATIGLRWFAAGFGLTQYLLLAQRHRRRVAAQARLRPACMINHVSPRITGVLAKYRLPNRRAIFAATAVRIMAVPMSNDSFRRDLALRHGIREGRQSTPAAAILRMRTVGHESD